MNQNDYKWQREYWGGNMAKLIDETGNIYGRLTVLKRDGVSSDHHAMWLCQCSCGNLTRVIGKDLRSGHTTSCGCYNKELITNQIIGQKFNKLTVLKHIGTDNNRNSLWECQCDCGNVIITTAKSLKSNHKFSCGCDTRSQGEIYVEDFLKQKQYSFQREYSFKDLKDKSFLRFDFVLFENQQILGCIEIQGSQHYNKTDGYYKEEMIIHDNMKRTYCKNNNIPLLELDYSKHFSGTNFSEWDKLILQFIQNSRGEKYDI